MYSYREDVEADGMMAYGPNVPSLYRQAATLVHKILRGAKPADLPVEQPTKFELMINAKNREGDRVATQAASAARRFRANSSRIASAFFRMMG